MTILLLEQIFSWKEKESQCHRTNFKFVKRKGFSLDNCNPNATGLGISKWQFKIYFYLTYELGVELVIYWMCRLIICGTICVNFDSIKSWKLMEDDFFMYMIRELFTVLFHHKYLWHLSIVYLKQLMRNFISDISQLETCTFTYGNLTAGNSPSFISKELKWTVSIFQLLDQSLAMNLWALVINHSHELLINPGSEETTVNKTHQINWRPDLPTSESVELCDELIKHWVINNNNITVCLQRTNQPSHLLQLQL